MLTNDRTVNNFGRATHALEVERWMGPERGAAISRWGTSARSSTTKRAVVCRTAERDVQIKLVRPTLRVYRIGDEARY